MQPWQDRWQRHPRVYGAGNVKEKRSKPVKREHPTGRLAARLGGPSPIYSDSITRTGAAAADATHP
jgi:hypothetical protein